jgi:hypothetical protein
MNDRHDLVALGFVADGDGTLRAPVGSVVTLTPTTDGHFFRFAIALPGGAVVSCVIARNALKTTAPEIDVEALISATPRRRPW